MRNSSLLLIFVLVGASLSGCLKPDTDGAVVSQNDPFPSSSPDAAESVQPASTSSSSTAPSSPPASEPEPEPEASSSQSSTDASNQTEGTEPNDETNAMEDSSGNNSNANETGNANGNATADGTGNATHNATGNTTTARADVNQTVSWTTSMGYATCIPATTTCPRANPEAGDQSTKLGGGNVTSGQLVLTWDDDLTPQLRIRVRAEGQSSSVTVAGASPLILAVGNIDVPKGKSLVLSVEPACSGNVSACATSDVDITVDGWLLRASS